MSYPTIGMKGWAPNDDWSPAAIEQMLRDGHHIYIPEDEGISDSVVSFNAVTKKFEYDFSGKCLVTDIDGACIKYDYPPVVHEFDTLNELTVWYTFMGKEIL